MSEEDTLLLPGVAGGRGAPSGVGPLPAEEGRFGCEEVGDTALDASQRLLQMAAAKERGETSGQRGRTRERGHSSRVSHAKQEVPANAIMEVDKEFTNSQLEDAAIAAEALAAAIGRPLARPQVTAVTDTGSLDSVSDIPGVDLTDKNPSPEKKPRVNKAPAKAPQATPKAPHFGSYPPLFHGDPQGVPPGAAGASTATSGDGMVARPLGRPGGNAVGRPEHFHLDPDPPWLAGLRTDLRDISLSQKELASQMDSSARELRQLREGIHQLGEGQSQLSKRADAQDNVLRQMQQELKELEREVPHLKSAPPTRSVSPAPSYRDQRGGGGGTPRYAYGGQVQEVDDLQIVVGGWKESRRQDIEMDVQTMFERLRGTALLGRIFVPYVRCSFCRIEINYPEQDIWKQRKLQGVLVQSLKQLGYTSQVAGQEGCRFWAARNRSAHERAKIRAILSTRDLCQKHLGEHLVDMDWRGRVWANSVQVLHHVDTKERPLNTLMLVDAKGNESGWFLDVDQVATILGVNREVILQHYDAH